jgi:hypothetical protein
MALQHDPNRPGAVRFRGIDVRAQDRKWLRFEVRLFENFEDAVKGVAQL